MLMSPEHACASARPRRRLLVAGLSGVLVLLLAGCALAPKAPPEFEAPAALFHAVNRIGWGATAAQLDEARRMGWGAYVQRQLRADPRRPLAPGVQAQIDALSIQQADALTLAQQIDQMRRDQDKPPTEEERRAARQRYQSELNHLAREAGHRQLLRQLYGEQQLQENIAWFWFNHFNVHQYKRELRALVADYEENALRPQALGSFRQMLGAVARHPAMQRYLDNDQNSAGKPNENYARELLELHTLGVDGGYMQQDVQELARVLTGFGVRIEPGRPKLKPEHETLYRREGLFEFNPARHDFGDKTVLGHRIKGRGAEELDEVLDLLVAHPSTARFIARKLSQYLLGDTQPALQQRMARAFSESRGDIAATLRPLLLAPEFAQAPRQFKDPQHYLLSSLRAAYALPTAGGRVIVNSAPIQSWLRRLGEGLYDKVTPDGYPMAAEAWNSAGQLSTRFELARALGQAQPPLFSAEGSKPPAPGAVPKPALDGPLFREHMQATLSADSRDALAQARPGAEWNALLLSAPEFMLR